MDFLNNYIYYIGAFGLFFIGLYTMLIKKNLIKIIIGLTLLDSGIYLFFVAVGYLHKGTAPIISGHSPASEKMVDPVPQALILTAIVIGVSILALALSLAVKLYQHYHTLNIKNIKELKW
ncbi:MAG TPA: sodium:proton antiporter [Spirochaetota bacterium]|nr:sodium:proton antiporter [Spirochaetota bacterium]